MKLAPRLPVRHFPAPTRGVGDGRLIHFLVESWTNPPPCSWIRLSPGALVHPAGVYREETWF